MPQQYTTFYKLKRIGYLFLLMGCWSCESKVMNKSILYQSKEFTVYADSVVQGKYTAVALSDSEITSNYQSPANQTFSRLIAFKFSINGKDNEQTSGVDHHLVLYPQNGQVVSPLIVFGQPDTARILEPENDFLEPNTRLTLRLDLHPVLESFQKKGYYTTYNGDKLYKSDFKGVYVAGGSEPLSWDFENLPNRPHLQLKDPDGDGTYEVVLTMNPYNPDNFTATRWKLEKELAGLPRYESPQRLVNALHNLALEEMMLNIRPDSTFMAGAKWEGVWTRDISYSILLSLAAVRPDIAKNSLLRKVKNGRIIQDTGTGGSWPISTDRTTWALAAWEVYAVTGDRAWLEQAYAIIRASAEDDLKTIVDPKTKLFLGESSFLDWRKQTYPLWMEPIDIFSSECLGTNAVHYQTYQILAEMAGLLGQPADNYRKVSASIKQGINEHLWLEEKGFYGQYLYGKHHLSLSPRSEALGEALCILFDIADANRQKRVIQNTPVLNYGIPSIYPQIPGIPPYHNDAIWPFVQAYWTWAAAKTGNATAVNQSMGALYRQAALFVNNKENFVARTGDFKGTETNSDRQLWSVAGNLAMVYRVLFGIEFGVNELTFKPFVPPAYGGVKILSHFRYRDATLTIRLEGVGSGIESVTLDGKALSKAAIPGNLQGSHELTIKMKNQSFGESAIHLVENHVAPNTPLVQKAQTDISWLPVKNAVNYQVYRNGQLDTITHATVAAIKKADGYNEYQIAAVDTQGFASFLSAPVVFANQTLVKIYQAEKFAPASKLQYQDFTGTGFIELSKTKNTEVNITVTVVLSGTYLADFRYANGCGPINTDNKCAIRTLKVNGQTVGAVAFPQRGFEEWSNWGYTNSYPIRLESGEQIITLRFEPFNENMNGEVNAAMLDHLRLIKID